MHFGCLNCKCVQQTAVDYFTFWTFSPFEQWSRILWYNDTFRKPDQWSAQQTQCPIKVVVLKTKQKDNVTEKPEYITNIKCMNKYWLAEMLHK